MKAPDFSLGGTESFRLSNSGSRYKVIYFYPKDDTPGCTIEAKGFSRYMDEFEDLGAEVIGISGGTEEDKEKFCSKYDLRVKLLSDEDYSVSKRYGAYKDGIRRNTYIISGDDVMREFHDVDPNTNPREVLNFLNAVDKRATDNFFASRWSPRSMSGDKVTEEELYELFNAARWAPSSYNKQPWRFLYGIRGTVLWNKFREFLVDFNKQWTENAGALILILSKKNDEGTNSFDTGAAWQNFALSGAMKGLVIHAMSGFDYKKAREELGIPEQYNIEAMASVGRAGDKIPEGVPDSISQRKKIEEFTGDTDGATKHW